MRQLPHSLCLMGAIIVAMSPNAAAENKPRNFIPAGILLSATGHNGGDTHGGFGVEASWVRHRNESDAVLGFGYGAFLQAQSVGWFDHGRFAVGPQLNYSLVGVELGGSLETGRNQYASTTGVHVAPFVSLFGFLSFAVRLNVPVAAISAGERYPFDSGLVITAKFPLPVESEPLFQGPLGGRH